MMDGDYYILTLAAVARELNIRKQTSACVHLAAGLPLTWVSEQKNSFKAYLLQNEAADFSFRGVDYHVGFAGADVFPQGFSAVADRLREFKGTNMLIWGTPQNRRFCGERRSSGMNEPSALAGGERYGACDDEVGGGDCLVKNFGEFEADRVIIYDDICAAAKGYEYLARLRAKKGGAV